MRIVTPERWYIAYWTAMGVGYLALQGVVTYAAVRFAIRHEARRVR